MTNHIQLSIKIDDSATMDQIIAGLSVMDFEGFEEKEGELLAFIPEENFDEKKVAGFLEIQDLQFEKTVIPPQNWNAVWEENFEPVIVGYFCSIRADFHPENKNTEHEIIITPKMSFGTGHHATTYMMVEQMSALDFKGKSAADFGTGTGVLAILAEKLGAASVWAIDNDEWSIENAQENIEKNNCKKVEIEQATSFSTSEKFDIILANINKNVILDNIKNLAEGLQIGGELLMSGLLVTDEADIIQACQLHNLKHKKTVERNNWICMLIAN